MLNKFFHFSIQQRINLLFSSFIVFPSKKNRRFLVVDFSLSSVKVVYVEPWIKGLKILKYGMQKLEIASEKNEGIIEKFLSNFLKKNSIFEQDVKITFSEPDAIVIKNLDLPVLPAGEILSAAKWQLKEEVPFDLEDSCIEWQIAREHTDEEGLKKNGVIFVIAKRQIIDKYLSFVYKCNLDPLTIAISSINYSNILNFIPNTSELSAILDIDARDSTLSIYTNKKLFFVRKLPVSWEKLTQSLTGELVTEKGRVQLSWEEAEKIKNVYGIPIDESQIVHDHIQSSHIMSLMRPILETLVREIKFSMDYFSSSFDASRPNILYLTGEGANLKNLDQYLSKDLNLKVLYLPWPNSVSFSNDKEKKVLEDQKKQKSIIKVESFKPDLIVTNTKRIINAQGAIPVLEKRPVVDIITKNITNDQNMEHPVSLMIEQPISQWEQNVFINLIGAALTDVQNLNLLPLEIKNKKTKNFINFIISLCGVFLGIGLMVILFSTSFQMGIYKDKLKNAQIHLKKIDGIWILRKKVSLRENLIEQIHSGKVPVEGVLKIISVLIPPEIILDELSFDQANHSLVLKGVVSSGEDISESLITNFMGKLEASSFFSEASLVFSQRVGMVQKFEIKCEIVH